MNVNSLYSYFKICGKYFYKKNEEDLDKSIAIDTVNIANGSAAGSDHVQLKKS